MVHYRQDVIGSNYIVMIMAGGHLLFLLVLEIDPDVTQKKYKPHFLKFVYIRQRMEVGGKDVIATFSLKFN